MRFMGRRLQQQYKANRDAAVESLSAKVFAEQARADAAEVQVRTIEVALKRARKALALAEKTHAADIDAALKLAVQHASEERAQHAADNAARERAAMQEKDALMTEVQQLKKKKIETEASLAEAQAARKSSSEQFEGVVSGLRATLQLEYAAKVQQLLDDADARMQLLQESQDAHVAELQEQGRAISSQLGVEQERLAVEQTRSQRYAEQITRHQNARDLLQASLDAALMTAAAKSSPHPEPELEDLLASHVMMLLVGVTTSVVVVLSLVWSSSSEVELQKVRGVESGMQTEGPTAEEVEERWSEAVKKEEESKKQAETSAEHLRSCLEKEQKSVLSLHQQLQWDSEKLTDITNKGEKEVTAFGKTRVELEGKVLKLEKSLDASRKELEGKVAKLEKTLELERKSTKEVQRQLEKQQQEQQQDTEKAQRQMSELRETLERKKKTISSLQAQVEQQKLIIIAAQQHQQAFARQKEAQEERRQQEAQRKSEGRQDKSTLSNLSPKSQTQPLALTPRDPSTPRSQIEALASTLRGQLNAAPSPRATAHGLRESAVDVQQEKEGEEEESKTIKVIVEEIKKGDWATTSAATSTRSKKSGRNSQTSGKILLLGSSPSLSVILYRNHIGSLTWTRICHSNAAC